MGGCKTGCHAVEDIRILDMSVRWIQKIHNILAKEQHQVGTPDRTEQNEASFYANQMNSRCEMV